MNSTLTLKHGDTVEITLGSTKTRNLRTLRGEFIGLNFRRLTDTHDVVEAKVMTSEGIVTDTRVVKVESDDVVDLEECTCGRGNTVTVNGKPVAHLKRLATRRDRAGWRISETCGSETVADIIKVGANRIALRNEIIRAMTQSR